MKMMLAGAAAMLSVCLPLDVIAQSASQKAFAGQLIKNETTVKDAVWMNDRNLYVGLIDDGTRRDGYAKYICGEAKPHGAKMVKAVDIAKLKRTGKFVEIGKAHCD